QKEAPAAFHVHSPERLRKEMRNADARRYQSTEKPAPGGSSEWEVGSCKRSAAGPQGMRRGSCASHWSLIIQSVLFGDEKGFMRKHESPPAARTHATTLRPRLALCPVSGEASCACC